MTRIQESRQSNHKIAERQIKKPAREKVEAALIDTIGILTGKTRQAEEITKAKPSEDIVFGGLVLAQLREGAPALAERFLTSLPKSHDKKVAKEIRQPIFRATQEFLNRAVKRGELSAGESKRIVLDAFGRAQLDTQAASIARKPNALSPNEGLSSVLDRVENNDTMSAGSFEKFKAKLAKHKFLSTAQADKQRSLLNDIFPEYAPNNPSPPAPSPKTQLETDSFAIPPDGSKIETKPNQLVFKPRSEKDGRMLVQIPVEFTPLINGVTLELSNGTQYELKGYGEGDDGRGYYRSEQSIKELAGSANLVLSFAAGGIANVPIEDANDVLIKNT